ncbi:hypothetical protein RRF57_010748 [Xylaria bambusicola]|uniref:Uncharacterized protein n=1 Tax=Xylaria bambusicola TaxID=326684 RepID=A0AAN7UYK2_9PEZI
MVTREARQANTCGLAEGESESESKTRPGKKYHSWPCRVGPQKRTRPCHSPGAAEGGVGGCETAVVSGALGEPLARRLADCISGFRLVTRRLALRIGQ